MASENRSDRREASEAERLKDTHPSPRPAPQGGAGILNSGLESLRSSDC